MTAMTDKVALVVGGARGIGLAIAKRLSSEGAVTYVTGREKSDLATALAEIESNGRSLHIDAANPADLREAVSIVMAEQGRVDTLIINAGMSAPSAIDEITEDHFDRHITVNVRAAVFAVQAALPAMPAGSSIVLIGSVAGLKAAANFGAYAASKAALRSFARTWTVELAPRGLRINVISPGPTATAMMSALSSDIRETLTSQIPLRRLARVDEIAAAALFLASDESSFVAGAELCVDGGMAQI